jgi:hypothetical protein
MIPSRRVPHSSAVDASVSCHTSALEQELRTLAATFVVRAPDSFALDGAEYQSSVPDAGAASASRLSAHALELLGDVLYWQLHCRAAGTEPLRVIPPRGAEESGAFAAGLSAANCGEGWWHEGWTLQAITPDCRLRVERDGLMLWAQRDDFACDVDTTPGVQARVRFPKEYINLFPGHYVAVGDAHRGGREETVRVYWNLSASGAETLMSSATRALNRARVSFLLKILGDPHAYRRTDAAILYVSQDHWRRAVDPIREVYDIVRDALRPSSSAYAMTLAPGVALAEDPEGHVSFGQHRSRLLAAALAAESETRDAFENVLRSVAQEGLDLRRFHLNAGSTAEYEPL